MAVDLPDWLDRTLRLRCPACADGKLFESLSRMHARCPTCGLDLVGRDGAQYGGAIVLSYAIGGIIGLLALVVILQFRGLSGLTIWLTLGVTFAVIIGSFRYCKAFWTWLLFRSGELTR